MKKLVRYVLLLLLILVLGGWLLLNLFDANQLKKPVLGWLNENTELDIGIGRLEFNPLTPYKLLAEEVRLGDWFEARQVYVELEGLASLAGETRVAIIDIVDGRLTPGRVRELALPASLADIRIAELNTRNLTISGDDWQLQGADLTLRDWQPRRQGQWQWTADLTLSGQVRQLSHPWLELSRASLEGRVEQGRLVLDEVRARLFDGLLDSRLLLDPARRELQLNGPRFTGNRFRLEYAPRLPEGWTLLLSRASLEDTSLTSPRFTANGIAGQLRYLEWNGRDLPEGQGEWQAAEAVLGWLRLDQHQGQWLGSRERLGLSLNGKAYQGSLAAELGWFPQQGRLDIEQLQLTGNKLEWHPDLAWPIPDLRIHKLNLGQGELLSMDPALPLSLLDGRLFIADLAWAAGQWRPLTEQARLEGGWGELAYDSLISRQAGFKARLDDTRLRLDEFDGEWLEGRLRLEGRLGIYPPYPASLRLDAEDLALRRLSSWLRKERGFSGKLNLNAELDGELHRRASWTGELRLDAEDLFVERLGLDDWLRRRLGEDYAEPRAVDPALAALDLAQSDGFIYRAELAGPVRKGRWQLNGSAVQSVRHLLALRGELDLAGGWDLELGAVNDQGCRELAIRLQQSWRAPKLRLHQPAPAEPCRPWYRGPLAYPAAGLPGNLIEAVRNLPQEP